MARKKNTEPANPNIPVYHYGEDKKDGGIAPQWWLSQKEEAAQSIFTVVNSIRNDQKRRRQEWLNYARLFANQDIDATLSGLPGVSIEKRLSFNIVKGVIKAACAKISKAKPRPMYLTSGGTYGKKRKAQKLTQYIDGKFTELKIYRVGRKVFRDGCIFGTGLLKVMKAGDRVQIQRTFPDEVVVDNVDGREGEPRQLHHIMALPREAIVSSFGVKDVEALDAIKSAKTASDVYKVSNTRIADRIVVIESWHLPSDPNMTDQNTDGSHKITVSNYEIFSEKWNYQWFPFAKFQWDEPILGFWGDALSAEVVGIQLELNNVLQRIRESLEMVAIPRVFIEEGSGVTKAKITDEIGSIVPYRGTAPTFHTPTGLNPETYQWVEYLYKKGFEETGISQLSAQSKKPAGLESGVALREYQDIETERFALVGEAYQQFYLDAAAIIIAFQKEIETELKATSKKSRPIKVKGRGFLETIDWKEVDMEEDEYIMAPYPTNFLPRTPEGQLQFTQELVQSGYVDEKEALSLLDFPDLQRFFNLRVSALDDIERLLENMIERGMYQPPEPYMDLNLCLRTVQSAYLKAKNDEVPESRLELLRRFLDDTQDLITQMSSPPPGAAPGTDVLPQTPGVGPTPAPVMNPQLGAPGAIGRPDKKPRSDLIPQVTPG